ncbi:MAG TPA: hypothetical protein VK112_02875 [Fodinibius sp.]|nr:hypothetical protein [Fodinibius sp.]
MNKAGIYFLLSLILVMGLLMLVPALAIAQEKDTTRKELNVEPQKTPVNLQPRMDRELSGGAMTEMGSYKVPEETEYYNPPFKGQEYLDMAVEAYRKELENRIGSDWFWKFLDTISPYIYNGFEFGVYQINDQPVVERDNPLFQSYKSKEKRQ